MQYNGFVVYYCNQVVYICLDFLCKRSVTWMKQFTEMRADSCIAQRRMPIQVIAVSSVLNNNRKKSESIGWI